MKTLLSLLALLFSLNVFALQKQTEEALAAQAAMRANVEAMQARRPAVDMDAFWAGVQETYQEARSAAARACFTAGTQVLMSDGTCKNIEEVEVGDDVLSWDIASQVAVVKSVSNISIEQTSTLIDLKFAGGVIETTPDHLFYSAQQGWVPAGELNVDDLVLTHLGQASLQAKDIRNLEKTIDVYDLTVDGTHTYFVVKSQGTCLASDEGVLVHNCNSPTGQFVRGAAVGFVENIPMPGDHHSIPRGSSAFEAGRATGNGVAGVAGGLLGFVEGAGLTGISCVGSACAAAPAGVALAGAGVAVAGYGSMQISQGINQFYSQGGNSNSGTRSSGPVFKTTKEASAKANELGFEKINERVNGQPVYKKGKEYITRDVDGHNGGAWKKANSIRDLGKKETRLGTYDANLNRIGD